MSGAKKERHINRSRLVVGKVNFSWRGKTIRALKLKEVMRFVDVLADGSTEGQRTVTAFSYYQKGVGLIYQEFTGSAGTRSEYKLKRTIAIEKLDELLAVLKKDK